MASAYSYFCFAYWLIDQEELAETWHEITYDSYIVDVRRVRKTKAEGYSKAVAEVCKYAQVQRFIDWKHMARIFISQG